MAEPVSDETQRDIYSLKFIAHTHEGRPTRIFLDFHRNQLRNNFIVVIPKMQMLNPLTMVRSKEPVWYCVALPL